jgi:hypothetical protein
MQKSISISMKQIGGIDSFRSCTDAATRPCGASSHNQRQLGDLHIHAIVRSHLPQVFIDANTSSYIIVHEARKREQHASREAIPTWDLMLPGHATRM